MNRKLKMLLLALLILTAVPFLTGCAQEENPYVINDTENYSVSVKFDANGGFFTTNTSVIVDSFNIGEMSSDNGQVSIPLLSPDNSLRGNDAFKVINNGHFLTGWYTERQETADGYYDLIPFFLKKEYVLAYMLFRFYSPEDQDAVLAVSVSDGGRGWFNGESLFTIAPSRSGEFTAPFHYKVRLKKGNNFLRVKVVDPPTPAQHRAAWGAGLKIFTV